MTTYLRYVLKNEEPLRIADDSTRQSGQSDSLRYISGSAIQGYIVSLLCARGDFEKIKKELFSKEIAYLNAYLTTEEHTLIPSPKGFYEDKSIVEGEKSIQNVVKDGEFSDGMKRAGLGSFAFIKDNCIHYYNVNMAADMKNLINPGENQKRSIFRNDMISAGQYFEGYIRLGASEQVNSLIESLFKEGQTLHLGNARKSGMGACRIIKSEKINELPWQGEAFRSESSCYMMILSDTAMRNDKGEICGLDLITLQKLMGVEDLNVEFASTSVRSVHGYNRTWKTKLPIVKAYEAGSVFHFTYNGVLEKKNMQDICDRGIGIRRTEGFGRVMFLKNYENVSSKFAEKYSYSSQGVENVQMPTDADDLANLKQVARNYYKKKLYEAEIRYIISNPLKRGDVSDSKIGSIQAILLQNRYNSSQAWNQLRTFFEHERKKEKDKRIQKKRASIKKIEEQIMRIINRPLRETLMVSYMKSSLPVETVMGLPIGDVYSEKDEEQEKLQLLVRMIRYSRKED